MPPVDKLGRRIVALMAGDGVKPIRAYHGSPHNFDRFDASKIGTGEGAQAYGHGLYFAQNPHVAEQYREELSAGLVRHTPSEKVQILWRYHDKPGSGDVKSTVRDRLAMDQERLGIDNRAAIEYLESLPAGFVPPPPAPPPRLGRVYEVELGVPEQSLLDWDRPIGLGLAGRLRPDLVSDLAGAARRMAAMGQLPRHQEALGRIASGEPGLATGEMLYRAAGRYDPPDTRPGWGSVTNTINDTVTNQALASARLAEAGIPGIRYLDQHSRAAGKGATRNYVMFPGTEDSIRILRKYGLLAPMALPAMQEGE